MLARRVLNRLFDKYPGLTADTGALVTEALLMELRMRSPREASEELLRLERLKDYPGVGGIYKVIASETRSVVVHKDLLERLESGERVSSPELIAGSVQMWTSRVLEQSLRPVHGYPELYKWTGRYDPDFLGYMEEMLDHLDLIVSGIMVA